MNKMKQFTSTKFFCLLQEASQTDIDIEAEVLKTGYDDFINLLFSKNNVFPEMTDYHNALVYTRVEFSRLKVSGKKYDNICCKNWRAFRQPDRIY